MNLLVTGTDTGVGKTVVAAGLILAMRAAGFPPAPFKPVESGHATTAGGWPPDAACLAAASALSLRREEVTPFAFEEALAPAVAAHRKGFSIDLAALDAAFASLRTRFGRVVVEGAGGVAVPVTSGLFVSDLARRWNLSAVLVVRPGLGTLNHAALSAQHLRTRGVPVHGLVVSRYPPQPNVAEATNLEWLPRVTGLPILAVIPDVPATDVDRGFWQPAAQAASQALAPFVASLGQGQASRGNPGSGP